MVSAWSLHEGRSYLPPTYVVRQEGTVFTGVCLLTLGGVPGPGPGRGAQVQVQMRGSQVQVQMRGSQVQVWGGPRSRSQGGVPGPGPGRGGVPGLRLGGYPVSGLGGYLVSVKGKIFDTRFGLIHVQTGKNFLSRTPPRNSNDLLWLHGRWYASCVHAGGLSFFSLFVCSHGGYPQSSPSPAWDNDLNTGTPTPT